MANPGNILPKSVKWTPARITHLRFVMNLTQEKLALMLGVSIRTVGRWETGGASPSRGYLTRALDNIAMMAEANFEDPPDAK
jgi:DNA-binding transcriptional regulator YiaG